MRTAARVTHYRKHGRRQVTASTLRTSEKATWDEQGSTPVRLTPLTPSHAHDGAPSGTRRDTPAPGDFTCSRKQSTPTPRAA